jgi:hypothetical protein
MRYKSPQGVTNSFDERHHRVTNSYLNGLGYQLDTTKNISNKRIKYRVIMFRT